MPIRILTSNNRIIIKENFTKYPCHVHKDRLEPKNETKNRVKPKKTCLFHACSKIPEMRDPSK